MFRSLICCATHGILRKETRGKLSHRENEVGLTRKRGRQPQRTCIVCRSKKDKGELLRLVLDDMERVYLDKRQHHRGRGAYVCPRPDCLTRLKQIHLTRAFRRALSADAWNPGIAMAEALKGCNCGL
jgi:predicted RNA-binding protein YlxR (DUF448 family)